MRSSAWPCLCYIVSAPTTDLYHFFSCKIHWISQPWLSCIVTFDQLKSADLISLSRSNWWLLPWGKKLEKWFAEIIRHTRELLRLKRAFQRIKAIENCQPDHFSLHDFPKSIMLPLIIATISLSYLLFWELSRCFKYVDLFKTKASFLRKMILCVTVKFVQWSIEGRKKKSDRKNLFSLEMKLLKSPWITHTALNFLNFMRIQGPLSTTSCVTRTVSVLFTVISPVPKI